MIIIMRFGENNVLCPKYIDIYEFWGYGGLGGNIHIPQYIFCLSFKKTEKVQGHYLYLNQILHNFDLEHFFHILTSLRSEYSTSNWFHSNTLNSMHLFNTNMYLIHFHSKHIINICFPKSWVFKVSNLNHSLSITVRWNKLRWHHQRLNNNVMPNDFQKNN